MALTFVWASCLPATIHYSIPSSQSLESIKSGFAYTVSHLYNGMPFGEFLLSSLSLAPSIFEIDFAWRISIVELIPSLYKS